MRVSHTLAAAQRAHLSQRHRRSRRSHCLHAALTPSRWQRTRVLAPASGLCALCRRHRSHSSSDATGARSCKHTAITTQRMIRHSRELQACERVLVMCTSSLKMTSAHKTSKHVHTHARCGCHNISDLRWPIYSDGGSALLLCEC
jgi:hypothetical protein